MSTMDDIRAEMARQGGPVKPADIAELLELERNAVVSAMYQAAKQEAGIQRYDDGTYGLIPGWKPRGAAAAADDDADEPAASPPSDDAPPPARRGRQAKAKLVKPAKDKPERKPRAAKKAKVEKPSRKPRKPKSVDAPTPRQVRKPRVARDNGSTAEASVTLPTTTVRILARAAIASGTRDPAILEAAAAAALALV